MIDHCVAIEDREERTVCAKAIANSMVRLFPSTVDEKTLRYKIWDHINIMADFKLDIDFPCEVTEKENIHPVPTRIPYQKGLNRFRHYGKNLQKMIQKVASMENNVEKDQLIFLLANQMKKQLVSQNPEIATDQRVFNDINEISRGQIKINPESYRLNDYIGVTSSDNGKKKKKNNNQNK